MRATQIRALMLGVCMLLFASFIAPSAYAYTMDGTTDTAPTLARHDAPGGRLYLFSKGIDDKRIYVRSASGFNFSKPENWTAWKALDGTTDRNPAATSHGARLYLFAKGINDKRIYVRSTADGNVWSTWNATPAVTNLAPAAASYGGKLYLFTKGTTAFTPSPFPHSLTDNRIYVSSSTDGTTWSSPIPLDGATDVAPAAVSHQGRLYLFAKGIDDKRIYMRSTLDGNNWTPWQLFDSKATTDTPVAVVSNYYGLFVYAKGIDDRRIYETRMSSSPTKTWTPLPLTTAVAPSAANACCGALMVAVRRDDRRVELYDTPPPPR